MQKLPLILAFVSFIVAIIVLVFADGARSIYSGLFFVLIGVVLLLNARKSQEKTSE
jgi:hypothetical protein